MDPNTLPTPVLTGFDAVTQGVAALCYLGVGLAAWFRARQDARTQIFLALAVANVIALAVPGVAFAMGVRNPANLPRFAAAAMMAALGVGALLLFHFTQVFPRKRPWIRTAGIQMAVAYLLTPIAIAALVRFAPADFAGLTPPYVGLFLVFGFPLLVLLGVVLPVAAIVSLIRSYREALHLGMSIARPIAWILISQIAGGVLAVVFAPIISVAAPGSALVIVVKLMIWMLGLLTPLAFALAVWQYGLLEISEE
jgi:hypothetical protein